MKEIEGSSILLLGYGREGKSTHQYLLDNYPDKKIGIADQRKVEPLPNTSPELHTGKDYLRSLEQYDVIVRSPGIPFKLPELQRSIQAGKKVTSATNIFFSKCPGTVIGVTGTKGKSTTSSLTAHILNKDYADVRLVGNIGRPVLDYLPGANEETLFVAELSSQQLEDARYSPHIAIVLAIVPEHLNHHGSFLSYVEGKGNIVTHQTANDTVVFNPTHEVTTQLVNKSQARKFRFSLEKCSGISCYVNEGSIFVHQEGKDPQFVMSAREIPLLGTVNIENTLASISVGTILGVAPSAIRNAVKEFSPLPHRLEFVGEYRGIRFYNDSLSTIPEATIHALNALGNDVTTLIAGGYDRGLDFTELGRFLASRGLKTLILFPTTGEKIWKAVSDATPITAMHPEKYNVTTMKDAVRTAFDTTPSGKICLLSPAAASFGLFTNYEDRGDLFKKLVSEQ